MLAKLLKRETNETLRLVDFAAPVRNTDGTLASVIASHLNWERARETAASFEQTLKGNRTGTEVLVIGRDRTVLMGPAALVNQRLSSSLEAGTRVVAAAQR